MAELIETKGNYKNFNLKNLEIGQSVIFTKNFAEGKEIQTKYGSRYMYGVTYNGETATLFCSSYQNDTLKELGGEGDSIKVTKSETKKTLKNGMTILQPTYTFELV